MIIIAPYAQRLISGKRNPKNYPYWKELIAMIDEPIVQVGITGEEQLVDDFRTNLPLADLRMLVRQCDTWISCDSFFQHLGWDEGKKGIVLWSVSDPEIFGHPENINHVKDRSCLAEKQFWWWDFVEYDESKFVKPQVVYDVLKQVLAVEGNQETALNLVS